MDHNVLPSSSAYRCLDRFSLLSEDVEEDDDGHVHFWPVLCAILAERAGSVHAVIDRLETIAAVLGTTRSGETDAYGMLAAVLTSGDYSSFCDVVWPKIVELALQMPLYYPDGRLPVLHAGQQLRLSRGQAACLVAHQFLCTVAAPPHRSEFFDFRIWYRGRQRHPRAAEMYLTALLAYFDQLPTCDKLAAFSARELNLEGAGVIYSLHEPPESLLSPGNLASIELAHIEVLHLAEHTSEPQEWEYQGPHGAVVVSANKMIGFGESATQEEVFMGNTPEACPAVLVTPTLLPQQALVISGARPILRIRGERRDISWVVKSIPKAEDRQDDGDDFEDWLHRCRGGKMLLMDALELDNVEAGLELPDLEPENIDRELRKAVAAFSASASGVVWTPLWGCGAFCGDPAVKMAIVWLAASVSRVKLKILCDSQQQDFGFAFEGLTRWAADRHTAGSLRALLANAPRHLRHLEIIAWMMG
jgi:poly(ADP-ribose) glycohydrolase